MLPSQPRASARSHRSASDLRADHRPASTARRAHGRGGGLHDAADNDAFGKHVVIIVAPLAGQARGRCALEDQIVLVHFYKSTATSSVARASRVATPTSVMNSRNKTLRWSASVDGRPSVAPRVKTICGTWRFNETAARDAGRTRSR